MLVVSRARHRRVAGLLGFTCIAGIALAAFAKAPSGDPADSDKPGNPVVRIETGVHNAIINRLAVLPDSGEVITASDDKTARRWSLEDGRAIDVFRVPIGDGDEGALYAVAAAGKAVAIAGRTGLQWNQSFSVYLFHRETGVMAKIIPGLPAPVTAMALSADRTFLAVGMHGRGGLRVVNLRDNSIALKDEGFGGTISWIDYRGADQLAVASTSGVIKVYDKALKPVGQARLPQGAKPWAVALHPAGQHVAVGNAAAPEVFVYSIPDMQLRDTLRGEAGRDGGLSVVAFSEKGDVLYAAGSYGDGNRTLVRAWQVGSANSRDIPVADNTITDLAPLPNGRLAYATAEPSWGVLEPNGAARFGVTRAFPDLRDGHKQSFKVSNDGAVVEFGFGRGGTERVVFDLNERTLASAQTPRNDLRGPVASGGGQSVTDWQNGPAPKIGGRPVALEPNEIARSAAVGGGMAVLGTDFYVHLYRNGRPGWKALVPAPAWAVNVSGDGRHVIAGLGDGTLRWYDSATGKHTLTLFAHADRQRWVVWTPEGFFDHSPGGQGLVGYHVNQGTRKAGEFIAVEQLYNQFYRRDLVMAAFRGDRADLLQEKAETKSYDLDKLLTQGLPPKVQVVEYCATDIDTGQRVCKPVPQAQKATRSAKFRGQVPTAEVSLRVTVEDRGAGVGNIVLRRNGAVVKTRSAALPSTEKSVRYEEHTVLLTEGANDILVSAYSADGNVEAKEDDRAALEVTYYIPEKPKALQPLKPVGQGTPTAGGPSAADADKTILYMVSVGVSDYRVNAFDLENAANDAKAMTQTMRDAAGKGVYDRVEIIELIDKDVTIPNMKKAFDSVAAKARPRDMVLVFLAGHGEAVDGQYHFAPHDLGTKDVAFLKQAAAAQGKEQEKMIHELYRREGLSQSDFIGMLTNIQAAQTVVLLDTCYSSSFATLDSAVRKERDDTWVNKMGRSSGRFILAGSIGLALDSAGNEAAQTQGAGHGLFTNHLLDALRGKADFDDDRRVNIYELATYTRKQVRSESVKLNSPQEPTYYFVGSDFFNVRPVAQAQ